MFRAIRFAFMSLALGAIVSVLIAWACAYWPPELNFDPQLLAALRERESDRRERRQVTDPIWISYAYRGRGLRAVQTKPEGGSIYVRHPDARLVLQAGWPLPCVEGWVSGEGGVTSHHYAIALARPLAIRLGKSAWQSASFLPLRPLWPQFAIASAGYGAVAGACWLTILLARRMWRTWRGRCVHCNYILRGAAHERCPECGAALR